MIGLQDVVKVVRRADGKTKIHQGTNLTAKGALSGGFWGMLIGLIFWMPWLGFAIGAATGAISGKLTDIGIDDEFIKETAEAIKPGEAGVFMLVGESDSRQGRGRDRRDARHCHQDEPVQRAGSTPARALSHRGRLIELSVSRTQEATWPSTPRGTIHRGS